MRNPNPPFLELSFYSAGMNEKKLLLRFVEVLTQSGAKFTGEGRAHHGDKISGQNFASITDKTLESVPITDLSDMQRLMDGDNCRLIQVYMELATGIRRDVAEIVTYVSISNAATPNDHHPIGIWTDGDIFSKAQNTTEQCRSPKAGQQVYKKFRALVAALSPSYAAITVSWPLECPTDLSIDSRTSSFRNFYISSKYIGAKRLRDIRDIFTNVYVEDMAEGIYVSCTADFNPLKKSANASMGIQEEWSRTVANWIAALRP
jgi:hypothetical protein